MSCDEHIAQITAKPWAHILAPQGRRPYGFDWEAWSRDDVFEALADAREHYQFDARRTYLTGHSMGGHGAWHIGATFPDQFAAIGPSSGWISYWSYGGGMPSMETPSNIDALLLRGYSASDTLKLLTNLTDSGVYILHGGADQTVPIAQARFMRTRLAAFHPNFAYFEQPAADHWWGNECCDWPRMMAFFREQTSPPASEQTFVDFTTANPAVSSTCNWISIEAQQEQLEPSHVAIRQNAETRTFVGNTSNVARLAIDVSHLAADQPVDVTLDGQALNWLNASKDTHKLWFERQGNDWSPPKRRKRDSNVPRATARSTRHSTTARSWSTAPPATKKKTPGRRQRPATTPKRFTTAAAAHSKSCPTPDSMSMARPTATSSSTATPTRTARGNN